MIFKYCIEKITIKKNRDFFIEMLPYVSSQIMGYSVKGSIVEVNYTDEQQIEQIREKLDKLYVLSQEEKIQNSDSMKTETLLDRTHVKTVNKEPILNYLKEKQDIYEVGKGTYAYSGLFLKVFEYFTMKIKAFAMETFNAREYKFPTLFPVEDFKKGGYFQTFPHHIMFQTNIKTDIDILNRFAKEGISQELLENIEVPRNVLANAACGPIYSMLSGKIVKEHESPLLYYVQAKSYRNEADNVFELARLNEFTMSEIVMIGKENDVNKAIDKAKTFWDFLMDKLKFNCKIETANDSFFAGNYKKLKFFQLLGNSKQEFCMLLPHLDRYISCASVNYHRTHFSKQYNISFENENCHSACIAFGIERLVYAFLCQHGCDINKWDAEIKEEIEYGVSVLSTINVN